MNYDEIIDISIPLKEGMITYPNNPEYNVEELSTGSSIISKITMGTHTGTHIDAPKHVFKGDKGMADFPLSVFVGPAKVIDASFEEESISRDVLESANIGSGDRVLVKTSNSEKGFSKFRDDYVYLSSEGALYLAEKEAVLFGIDYLSVKKRGSKDNTPHEALLSKGIVIFEGLDLKDIEPGEYFFIGLPLALGDADGAPARAILLK